MKTTFAEAEGARDKVRREADQLHTQQLIEAIEQYIEAQQKQIKALRRLLN